jgi:hypothetical protein
MFQKTTAAVKAMGSPSIYVVHMPRRRRCTTVDVHGESPSRSASV